MVQKLWKSRIRASILNYKPHLLQQKSGLEANGLVKPQYCTFLLEKAYLEHIDEYWMIVKPG